MLFLNPLFMTKLWLGLMLELRATAYIGMDGRPTHVEYRWAPMGEPPRKS